MKTHRLRRAVLAVPFAIVAALAAPGAPRADDARVIEITAKRFEFQPSQITVRQGERVVLHVKSLDVVHGFYQKALGIDATIAPSKTTVVPFTAKAPGRYVTICDHFCGSGHGNMKMTIVVE